MVNIDTIWKLPVYERIRLARDTDSPPEVLEKLAKDDDDTVRQSVVNNPKTPKKTLEELKKDRDYWVRLVASAKLNIKK